MIRSVTLTRFKRFAKQKFELKDTVVLAGPNNAGKTTLLQALAIWQLSFSKWMEERGPESGSKAKKRTGVAITRKDFTAVPVRDLKLLWTDLSTGKSGGGYVPLQIELDGETAAGEKWELGFDFSYANKEQLYARPLGDMASIERVLEILAKEPIRVVHVPPFSGISTEETYHDTGYQDVLIGQGKPGDILRNLLWQAYGKDTGPSEGWSELKEHIREIFSVELLDPEYVPSTPYITCQYKDGKNTFDIASGGSGFHQVLSLLAFFYARPPSILLLDEPDAHLHFILQHEIYDRIRSAARGRRCQLIIATHAEVIINETSPQEIMSFYPLKPHLLDIPTDRDQVREALKCLTIQDILHAQDGNVKGILYVEDQSDFDILKAWANVLNHDMKKFFHTQFPHTQPFWHKLRGRRIREANQHFFALRALNDKLSGFLLLDGDNRPQDDAEGGAKHGMQSGIWKRYEIENYLLHPRVLERFVSGGDQPTLFDTGKADRLKAYLKEWPESAVQDPLRDHLFLRATPASKEILPELFDAVGVECPKSHYYQIAETMHPEEVHPDVTIMLNAMGAALLRRLSK